MAVENTLPIRLVVVAVGVGPHQIKSPKTRMDEVEEALAKSTLSQKGKHPLPPQRTPTQEMEDPSGMDTLLGHDISSLANVDGKFRIVVVEQSDDVCLGFKGQSGQTVCLARADCAVAHQGGTRKKLDAAHGLVLVLKGTNTAFTDPTARLDEVHETVVAEWQTQRQSLDEWREDFLAASRLDIKAHRREIKSDKRLLETAKAFRTPCK